jgi:hypothetical protein
LRDKRHEIQEHGQHHELRGLWAHLFNTVKLFEKVKVHFDRLDSRPVETAELRLVSWERLRFERGEGSGLVRGGWLPRVGKRNSDIGVEKPFTYIIEETHGPWSSVLDVRSEG